MTREAGLTAAGPMESSRTAVGQAQNPPIPLIRGCWIFSKMIVRRMGVSITMEKVNRTFPETFSSSLDAIGYSFPDAVRSWIMDVCDRPGRLVLRRPGRLLGNKQSEDQYDPFSQGLNFQG